MIGLQDILKRVKGGNLKCTGAQSHYPRNNPVSPPYTHPSWENTSPDPKFMVPSKWANDKKKLLIKSLHKLFLFCWF